MFPYYVFNFLTYQFPKTTYRVYSILILSNIFFYEVYSACWLIEKS